MAQLHLVFVINGVEQPESVNDNQPLHAARNQALAHSKNTGRPMDEWIVYGPNGNVLEPGAKVKNLGLTDGARLTLSLGAGAGG